MTTFNTGNAVPSKDPRDLSDNAENLDRFANGDQPAYPDRFGDSRKSIAGMESDFASNQASRATTFANFLASSGYEFLGEYAGGIEVTEYNQIIRESGEFWRPAASTSLPYTTTGAGMPESGAFVAVGDAALRQEIGSGIFRADSLANLESTNGRFDGDSARLVSGTSRDGDFRWDASDLSSTLVLASATSDSVDDTTDTINDADHPFSDGDGVITQATVNGLTAHTVYWVVNSTSGTYQLSATFGGGAIDLTGTTNFTVDHLADPFREIYVPQLSDKTGSSGCWIRSSGGIKSSVSIKIPTAYPTMQNAIEELSSIYSVSETYINLLIESGHQPSAKLFLRDGDYSDFRIISEDFNVNPENSVTVSSSFPAGDDFIEIRNARGPVLGCLFDMQGLGQNGLTVGGGSVMYLDTGAGVKNAGNRGVEVWLSTLFADSSDFSGAAGICVRASNGSLVRVRSANLTNAGTNSISCSESRVIAYDADCSGAAAAGITANFAGIVSATRVTCDNSGASGLVALDGGVIEFTEASLLNAGGAVVQANGPSRIDLTGSTLSTSTASTIGIAANDGALVDASDSIVTATSRCAQAENGAVIIASGATMDTTTSTWTLRVLTGGEVVAHSVSYTLSGGGPEKSQTANIITPSGIIKDSSVSVAGGEESIADGATSIVFPHGLSEAPLRSEVLISPTNSLGNASKIWISSVSDTNIAVFSDVDPGPDTARFSWQAKLR